VPSQGEIDERTQVLELVLRHGSNATAFQTVHAGFRYFWHGREACVAYTDTGRAWVAAGAPVAAGHERAATVSAFLEAARAAGKRACFFASEERLLDAGGQPLGNLRIGEQPVWDPRAWAASLSKHRSLREQLRRARAKGVSVRELTASDLNAAALRAQIADVSERWLASRRLAPMAFLVQLEPFCFAEQRRTFIAEQEGRVVGFAGLIPVPARRGWFLENLVRAPDAPNGTSELLVHAVMAWAGRDQCDWLTLGLAPLSGPLPPLLRLVRDGTRRLYDFAGLRAYKAKFRPQSWQPAFLCYPRTEHAAYAVIDALAAFAVGGFFRFGLRTLLRSRAVQGLRAFSVQLAPWTLLGPAWAAVAAAGYASRGSLVAATASFMPAQLSSVSPEPSPSSAASPGARGRST
jgi:phosphatidylglycerol lysyltransferase